MIRFSRGLLCLLCFAAVITGHAQEYVAPLLENTDLKARALSLQEVRNGTARRPTALTLPFFEDFTGYAPYPDTERWTDSGTYVNNTMAMNMISRGVATFDALDAKGDLYYDTVSAYTTIYADSLTSQPIDLSLHTPADSVYLSFFYEQKGYGFYPKPYDSLMLFLLKSNGTWEKVWSVNGDTVAPVFRQVMIPVRDTGYFNSGFQMRWVNKATLGISNSHWHLDYIRMEEGRMLNDTLIRDIAFTKDPASILNDFSAMPFRHFKTNPATFLTADVAATLRNNGTTAQNIPSGYTAGVAGGPALGSGTAGVALPSAIESDAVFPMYAAGNYNPPDPNARIVYENRFYCTGSYPGEPVDNDSIVSYQVFDNYFAYDDGTAEQSYFLNLFPNAPGYTAVEYALYAPDTLRGIAIRFARQIPSPEQKEFAIAVYRDIAVNGGTDDLLYQENFLYPYFEDSINKFSIYTFEQPLRLEPGTFFIGIVQAAGSSDSLHIALDVNRSGANHRYFKVENTWAPSLIDGALLLRPLVGAALPLSIGTVKGPELQWSMHPNPAREQVHIHIPGLNRKQAQYRVINMQGQTVLKGSLREETDVDIRSLRPGIYFVRIDTEAGYTRPVKLLKL